MSSFSAATLWPSRCRHHVIRGGARRPLQSLRLHATGDGPDAQRGRRGRHPELLQIAIRGASSNNGSVGAGAADAGSGPAAVVEQPRPEEVDQRYRRTDFSDVFQFESRQAFARCIAGGEPRMRLVEAALHVTAEDDAIASHSTVRFPVNSWMERVERLVEALCRKDMRRAAAAAGVVAGADGAAAAAAALLRVVERYLFEEVGFRMPEYGRSNLPANSLIDHAGVWEDARLGYLHETLVRRLGHPAALGLLLGEVCTQLLARGVLPCAAAIDTRSYMMLPRAVPLPALTRELLLLDGAAAGSETASKHEPPGAVTYQGRAPQDGGATSSGSDTSNRVNNSSSSSSNSGGSSGGSSLAGLNTCTSEVLVEMLRHLKRSYWPFPWDTGVDAAYPGAVGSHGGFRAAAKAAMGDDVSVALAAIGKVAAWRLERGIWTSPGAGDLRRARAACERLVLLAAERHPEERRDLAVLLLHCGERGAARLELRTYLRAVSEPSTSADTAAAAARTDPQGGRPGADAFDLLLCHRLLEALEGAGDNDGGGDVVEPLEPLGVESTLRATPPWERPAGVTRYLPLTW